METYKAIVIITCHYNKVETRTEIEKRTVENLNREGLNIE